MRAIHKVLVVDDDTSIRRSLVDTLAQRYDEVRQSGSVADLSALAEWQPDLVVLDVMLPDGCALDALDVLERRGPAPMVVAMSGRANRAICFALGNRGVRAYLDKPVSLDKLEAAIACASQPFDFAPSLRQAVGQWPLRRLQEEVRGVMMGEALWRSRGNVRGAARMLAISRELLRYLRRR
jgi:two-component system, response regulator RegA